MKNKSQKGGPKDITNTPLAKWIGKASELGVESLEIEYKDGQELICAMRGTMGFGIGSLDSSSDEAKELRKQLYDLRKRKRIAVGGEVYRFHLEVFDSFGEDAFRMVFERI